MAEAQRRLPSVLKQVKQGEDIGIIAGDQIIQLKPVRVVAWEEGYLHGPCVAQQETGSVCRVPGGV